MKKYIEIDAAKEAAHRAEVDADYDGRRFNAECVADALDFTPTADVAPIIHAHWVKPTVISGRAFNVPHCSHCDGVPCGVSDDTKYCAICGARMDES